MIRHKLDKNSHPSLLRDIHHLQIFSVMVSAVCAVLVFLTLLQKPWSALLPNWLSIAVLRLILMMIMLGAACWNWKKLRSYTVQIAYLFQDRADDISCLMETRKPIATDIKDSKSYIDVLHEQIGGSLAESEREIMALIDQLNLLSAQSSQQMERITHSVQSGKALSEATSSRVERNNQLISSLEAKLGEQACEMHGYYEQIRLLSDDVMALTPIIQVISSTAKQTSLLALNAGIEAARAGNAAGASPWLPMKSESCPSDLPARLRR